MLEDEDRSHKNGVGVITQSPFENPINCSIAKKIPKQTRKKHEEYNKMLLTLLACQSVQENGGYQLAIRHGLNITIQLPDMQSPVHVVPAPSNLPKNHHLTPKVKNIICAAVSNLSGEVVECSDNKCWLSKIQTLSMEVRGLRKALNYLTQELDSGIYQKWLTKQPIEYICHISSTSIDSELQTHSDSPFSTEKIQPARVHIYLAPYSKPSVDTSDPHLTDPANLSLVQENVLLRKRIDRLENYLVQLRKKMVSE